MFWKKSADAVRIAELEAVNEGLEIANAERAKTIEAHRREIEDLREASYGADKAARMYKRLYEGAFSTLRKIAEQETPTANATVKRMARMARSELPILGRDAAPQPQPASNGVPATTAH